MRVFWSVSSAPQNALPPEIEIREKEWGMTFLRSTLYNAFFPLWENSIAADAYVRGKRCTALKLLYSQQYDFVHVSYIAAFSPFSTRPVWYGKT